jgi:hypothetical protein
VVQEEFLKHKEEAEDEHGAMEARLAELEAERLEADVAREAQEVAQVRFCRDRFSFTLSDLGYTGIRGA